MLRLDFGAWRPRSVSLTLTALLVFALVPVLIFTTPNVARAAVQVGDTAEASITVSGDLGSETVCDVVGYLRNSDAGATVPLRGNCSLGFDVKWADVVWTAVGTGCQFVGSSPRMDAQFEDNGFSITLVSGGPMGPECVVTELCSSGTLDTWAHWSNKTLDRVCVPFALGALPALGEVKQDCQLGTVAKPRLGANYTYKKTEYTTGGRWDMAFEVGMPPAPVVASGWTFYVILKKAAGGDGSAPDGYLQMTAAVPGQPYINSNQVTTTAPPASVTMQVPESRAWSGGTLAHHDYDVIGAGYFANNLNEKTNGAAWYLTPQQNVAGAVGLSDPARCSFYWGEKVASTPNDDYDEPLGDAPVSGGGGQADDPEPVVETPPAPTPEDAGCGAFSLFDPSSWAAGGICVLVKAVLRMTDLLVSALNGVIGAVKAVAGAVLSGITALFVPSEGFLDSEMTQLRTKLEASPVGAWEAAVVDGWSGAVGGGSGAKSATATTTTARSFAGVTPSGGCMGPSITWDKLAVMGLPTSFHPIAACEGAVADVAGWVHLIFTLMIGLFALLKIVDMLTISLGMAKQASLMSGFDWGNDHVSRKY